ncbi:MAG: tRNA threonylcarbamoyladenosine dehydratase [Clostridia bacterium]|nr:tRNA threonylcarbamoyladenosine dehydratase [Clostridia bacterium]
MREQDARSAMLFGEEGLLKLRRSRVAVFGVGGVGGAAAEALARGGVGHLTLVDGDAVSLSNLNRQIAALHSTVGKPKAEVMAARARDVDPEIDVEARVEFFTAETADRFDFAAFDFVVDAIDTVSAKILLIQKAMAAGVPVISAMGAGNKLHPERFEIADLDKTSVCPLARVMRKELGRRGIRHLRVVYSREEPVETGAGRSAETGRAVPGSASFVPGAAGLLLAGEVIRSLTGA